METHLNRRRFLTATGGAGAAILLPAAGLAAHPRAQGTAGEPHIGDPLQVWIDAYGLPEIGQSALHWELEDGDLYANTTRCGVEIETASNDPFDRLSLQPVVALKWTWNEGSEPRPRSAEELPALAGPYLPADAKLVEYYWLMLMDHVMAGMHVFRWRSETMLAALQPCAADPGIGQEFTRNILVSIKTDVERITAMWITAGSVWNPK